jgi:putative ABC transport system permease protein
MRVLDHAIKSIIRNKTKTAMIFLMMFTVFSLIFSGVIIQNTITSSQSYIREKMGLFVEYKVDFMKYYEDNNYSVDGEFPSIDKELMERFSNSRYVEKTHVSKSSYTEFNDVKKFKPKGGIGGNVVFSGGEDFDKYFGIQSTNNSLPVTHEFGKITIVDREGFSNDELESGSALAYVSENFAKTNNLSVGDKLTYNHDGEIHTLTIKGLFSVKEGNQDEEIYNQIIVPQKYLERYFEDEESQAFNGSVFYQMKSAEDIESFKSEMSLLLNDEYTRLDANDEEYDKINSPLKLMKIITNILVYVIMVAGSLIMMSLVTIFVRDRKFEIGLLISSGESKQNILAQFVIEVVIIGLFAFVMAIGTSFIISGVISNWLVNSQLLVTQPKSNSFEMMFSYYNQVSLSEVASQFKISLNSMIIIRMFIVQLILMVASSVVPLLTISRYKPREIIAD